MNSISIIVPLYNEEESLRELYQEIAQVAAQEKLAIELIFIDDGSTDQSWKVISSLPECEGGITLKVLRFRRNFGKAAALNAGFKLATAEVTFTMDADLQDDPKEIPRFLEKLETDDLDVVSGWKKKRYDPWHKVGPSRIFNAMVSRLSGVKLHDHNCGFKCYRTELLGEINLYGELHRFVPVLAAAKGWKVGELVVHHRARQFGHSKYGVFRMVKGFLDLLTVSFLTGYGQRPQHLFGSLGLLSFFLGGLGTMVLAFMWVASRVDLSPIGLNLGFVEPVHLTERATFYYALGALFLGTQFISIGVLAELIAAKTNLFESVYSVQESLYLDDESAPNEKKNKKKDFRTHFGANFPKSLAHIRDEEVA
ncbi:MAG: glycosyltransferase family 2 protein [Pirellulaceae bacterium]|nr:glycosyltransferase family 2 protein [Pirellulaceae bacterium]